MTRRATRRRNRARRYAAEVFAEVIQESDNPKDAYTQATSIISEDFGSGPIAQLILEFILMLIRSLIEGGLGGASEELEGAKYV